MNDAPYELSLLIMGAAVSLAFGVIGGGLWGLFERYYFIPRYEKSTKAREKVQYYSKPLWVECTQLGHRLGFILSALEGRPSNVKNMLKIHPDNASSLEWFTKEGYFVTSTAYLFASVSAWITLFERDIVFLNFGDDRLTTDFIELIEEYKVKLSNSILWYHYIIGIGEELILEETNLPLTFPEFIKKIFNDSEFRAYHDQLFQYLIQISDGSYNVQISQVLEILEKIRTFLTANTELPEMRIFNTDQSKEMFDHYN